MNAQAIDSTLVTALVVALGMAICFFLNWRESERRRNALAEKCHAVTARLDHMHVSYAALLDENQSIRAALSKAVAAEVGNGGDSGPGEAA